MYIYIYLLLTFENIIKDKVTQNELSIKVTGRMFVHNLRTLLEHSLIADFAYFIRGLKMVLAYISYKFYIPIVHLFFVNNF